MQRGVAKHSFHQIHSVRGKSAETRCFSSCCVCARGCWKEDLRSVKLLVTATKFYHEDEVDEDEMEDPVDEDEDSSILSIHPSSVERLHAHIFDVYRYKRLWPLIPLDELLGSSVEHPTGKDKEGKPWRWHLNTKMLPSRLSPETIVEVCVPCSKSLLRKVPIMPKYALANSLWIGREPLVFRSDGKKLSPMTFLLLWAEQSYRRSLLKRTNLEEEKKNKRGRAATRLHSRKPRFENWSRANYRPLPQKHIVFCPTPYPSLWLVVIRRTQMTVIHFRNFSFTKCKSFEHL